MFHFGIMKSSIHQNAMNENEGKGKKKNKQTNIENKGKTHKSFE